MKISRREFLAGTTALAVVAVVPGLAVAQEATFKLGTWEGVKWIEPGGTLPEGNYDFTATLPDPLWRDHYGVILPRGPSYYSIPIP